MTAPNVLTVADWFVVRARADGDDNDLTNLKLQKLLYYAQGWHLALYDERAFADEVEAWGQGPVVNAAYHSFKSFGDRTIDRTVSAGPATVDQRRGNLLSRVWDTYGQFSAWKLRNMTHSERPWAAHYREGVWHVRIPVGQIQAFFAEEPPMHLAELPSVFADRQPVVVSSEGYPALRKLVEQARRGWPE